MVKLHHTALSIAAVSVAGLGAFAVLPAAAAVASPAPASAQHPASHLQSVNQNCGDGKTHGNEWDCLQIGQNPWYTKVTDQIIHSARTVQICLRKDGLPDKCTPFELIQPGQTDSAIYSYQGPGRYCAVVWRLNGNGSHSLVDAGQCLNMGG